MFEFVRAIARFLNSMDAKAITSLVVSLSLLIFVFFTLAFGQQWLNLEQDDQLSRILMTTSQSSWAVIGVISVFAFLALTAFPQILLITATIIVFGPQVGAGYSWIATMVSATLTFGLGHFLGGRWLRRRAGERVQRMMDFLSNHGILASGLIRVVPSAPFIVVNAAAGAAHIPLWKFWAGTGIGIIPKILLVALLAIFAPDTSELKDGVAGLLDFFSSREPHDFAIVAGIIAAWLGFLLFVRWLYRRMRAGENA